MAQDPYKYFRPEAKDLVEQFGKGVLDLEKGSDPEKAVQKLLRLAHTLKGAARVVKQSEIAVLAHGIEDMLAPFRNGPGRMDRAAIEALLANVDAISLRIPKPAAEPEGSLAAITQPEERIRTVRTDVAETEAVLDGVAETHALLNGLRSVAASIEQARALADQMSTQHALIERGRQSQLALAQRSTNVEELRRRLGGAQRALSTTIEQMDREFYELRDAAQRLRLVSADNLLVALERTARDAARELSKEVNFEGRGGDIRIDSHILETVQGALIQIVRNAVAHGIESTQERKLAGKPAAGRVLLSLSRRGQKIVLACEDDGRGVDFETIRRTAVERGLARAGPLKDEDIVQLLLKGGISTSSTVTAVSGRGIGLDVVREAVERLGGEVVLRSSPGVGTLFELVMPPSLASIDALLVEADRTAHPVAIPLDSVKRTLRIAVSDISRTADGMSISHDDRAIPFVPLASALEGSRSQAGRGWTAIVMGGARGTVAVGVERMLGTANIVVRPLPPGMPASPLVVGSTMDADGNPQLVLDPDSLVASVFGGPVGEIAASDAKRPVLVIDDSLTTRMLEQSILESAGYEVDVAISGEEGLERVRARRYALILVDVEMPGMDGFTFIEHLRADAALRDIPAILVTSLAEPEHIQRGRDVGAHGHIVKSEFDQAKLLSMIAPLAG